MSKGSTKVTHILPIQRWESKERYEGTEIIYAPDSPAFSTAAQL